MGPEAKRTRSTAAERSSFRACRSPSSSSNFFVEPAVSDSARGFWSKAKDGNPLAVLSFESSEALSEMIETRFSREDILLKFLYSFVEKVCCTME